MITRAFNVFLVATGGFIAGFAAGLSIYMVIA